MVDRIAAERVIRTLSSQEAYFTEEHVTKPAWIQGSLPTGDLSVGELETAWRMVVDRHESLRAVPVSRTDGGWQRILDTGGPFRIIDIAADEAAWQAVADEPWPQGRYRWALGLLEKPTRTLVLKACHATVDQAGLRILAADMARAVAAVSGGSAPDWQPCVQLSDLVAEESSLEGREQVRANGAYFAAMLGKHWIDKPVPERRDVTPHWLKATVVIERDCMRVFWAAARQWDVSWHILLRAAFLRAEAVVHASGRVRVGNLDMNRRTEARQKCVANLAVHVPIVLDTRNALTLPLEVWARQVSDALVAGWSHQPFPQRHVRSWNSIVGSVYARWPHRPPNYEFETGGNGNHILHPVPGNGNRIHEAFDPGSFSYAFNPTKVILQRDDGETHLSLFDHTTRCAAGSLNLLATCFLATIERYTGATDTPSIAIFEEAARLRSLVGQGPGLEQDGSVIAAVTESVPIAG